jgi:catechol 2,3-dioxygenase-like lactoylglutathione lyase family enzyme
MSDAIRLSSITLNCPDAEALARFYADMTGGEITYSGGGWATLVAPGGRIDFQTAEDYEPPQWPGAKGAQIHIDFYVDDLGATRDRALDAGASMFEFQPNAEHCLVFADPVGHPFCLSTVDEIG